MKQLKKERLANISHDDNILFSKIRRIEARKPIYYNIEDKSRNQVYFLHKFLGTYLLKSPIEKITYSLM